MREEEHSGWVPLQSNRTGLLKRRVEEREEDEDGSVSFHLTHERGGAFRLGAYLLFSSPTEDRPGFILERNVHESRIYVGGEADLLPSLQ